MVKTYNSYNSFMSPPPEPSAEPSSFAQNNGEFKTPMLFLSGEHSFKTARPPEIDDDLNTFA